MNLSMSMTSLSILQGEIMKGMSALDRISELIFSKPSIPIAGGKQLLSIEGNVDFMNVEFSYPTRKNVVVLQNFSLHLEKGKVHALVGPSGSGKSTVASLIERFYSLNKGSILLDGVDISTLDPSWLRSKIGIVSQEPVLFATSIEDNIRFGKPGASPEEIENAARVANCHDFITNFPHGYQTVVGERGVQLSGGQKQRIAIARAILKNAPILILDEATSALDSESEVLVQEALERLMKGRTVLIIAHRLSTIKKSDIIFVLKNGIIVEKGKHDELMAKKEFYASLVSSQLSNK